MVWPEHGSGGHQVSPSGGDGRVNRKINQLTVSLVPLRRTLANGFPLCGLSIVTAVDSTIYASDVIEASHQPLGEWQELVRTMPVRARGGASGAHGAVGDWGDQGVLILAGVRLGMEGVNPLYHDSIKVSRVAAKYCKGKGKVLNPDFAARVGTLHVPAVRRDCRWSSRIIILLYRMSSGQLVLPRPAFHSTRYSAQNTYRET